MPRLAGSPLLAAKTGVSASSRWPAHRLRFCRATRCGRLFLTRNTTNKTLVKDRFMAFDMFTDRMNPEAPSSAPAMINNLLPKTKPIAAADKPA